MGSLCLTMMYDIFEAHAQRDATENHSDRAGYIVKQLMAMLATGISQTEREVRYYAMPNDLMFRLSIFQRPCAA